MTPHFVGNNFTTEYYKLCLSRGNTLNPWEIQKINQEMSHFGDHFYVFSEACL